MRAPIQTLTLNTDVIHYIVCLSIIGKQLSKMPFSDSRLEEVEDQ